MTSPDRVLLDVRSLNVHLRSHGRVVRAVDDVSVAVRAGECVGIVGESGSGKSMLARAMLRLLPAIDLERFDGRVELDGVDLMGLGDGELRAARRGGMSMVFQEPMSHFNPTMRVGRQIAEALPGGRRAHGAEDAVRALLARVGLPRASRVERRYPHELSGGMRQRAMIALALASQPSVLIADEPTTALDVTVQIQILDTLRRLHAEEGVAIVVITHDLSLVAELCDRVYVMYAGQIVESADVVSLFERPRHPYTRALLASLPRREGAEDEAVLPGSVPNLAELPPGCRFAPRCPHAMDVCHRRPPVLGGSPLSAQARCWIEDGVAGLAEEASR